MTVPSSKVVTQLLESWNRGDQAALNQLMPIVYDELRRLARRQLRQELRGRTLLTSDLVHEAYIRLVDQQASWQNRAHFFGIAARLMRQILVDHARAKQSAKRGGEWMRVSITAAAEVACEQASELLALDEALTRLATFDPQQSQIVEMRFFGGLTIEETAAVLSVSHTTVERDWSLARAWLQRELQEARDKEHLP